MKRNPDKITSEQFEAELKKVRDSGITAKLLYSTSRKQWEVYEGPISGLGDTPKAALCAYLDQVDPLSEPELPTPIEAIRGYLDWITNKISAADYTESYGYYTFTDLFKAVVAAEKSHSKELSEAEQFVLVFAEKLYCERNISIAMHKALEVVYCDTNFNSVADGISTLTDRIRAKKGNKS